VKGQRQVKTFKASRSQPINEIGFSEQGYRSPGISPRPPLLEFPKRFRKDKPKWLKPFVIKWIEENGAKQTH